MSLSTGDKLGHFEILAPLGAGGMGEVYRARDTQLEREVAIKVLPRALAQDPERLARFDREAKILAALNHLNIAIIHGLAESQGQRALVMELVAGETLTAVIQHGPMPPAEACKIARQIAEALEAAHEKGVVHRDLKPGNVMLTPSGLVKVLDFGLAAMVQGSPSTPGDPANSPTLTIGGTIAGTILGTAHYMSPEQAEGLAVDKRSDIWSYGVVLWEMLTGQKLFDGASTSRILANVIQMEIDFTKLPPETPATIRALLRRCLDREVRNRLRDIGEARVAIDTVGQEPAEIAPSSSRLGTEPRPLGSGLLVLAALLLAALVIVSWIHFRELPPEAKVLRATVLPPDKTTFNFVGNRGVIALSPDGRRMVFAASTEDNKSQLYLRPLDAMTTQPLAGTEGGQFPFWSPDSRFVAFFAGGKLKKIDTAGGPPLTLADAPNSRGGAWSAEGVIVFAPNSAGPLQRISSAGGAIAPATNQVADKGINHRFPWFLPDGKHFLFASEKRSGGGAKLNLHIGSLDSRDDKVFAEADSNALYSESHILFLREDTLMAQPFDLKNLATAGEAVPVAEQVNHFINPGTVGVFSVSATGMLAFQPGAGTNGLTLTWFDRGGKALGTLGNPGVFTNIEFSPDRRSLAASVGDTARSNLDLWTYDVARGLGTRFTFDPALEDAPVWSPDGRAIAFESTRKGHADLYRKSADGAGAEDLLYADDENKYPLSWSPDGKFLLFSLTSGQGNHIWVLPLTPERPGEALKPFAFLKSLFTETRGRFSPDGRLVAYQSNESGRYEIYVAPFPGPGGKRQISAGGGSHPRWRQDGKEIFYVSRTQQLTAAEVRVNGNALEVGTVRTLFGGVLNEGQYRYDVSADGQRFLVAVAGEQKAGDPITLVENWASALKK